MQALKVHAQLHLDTDSPESLLFEYRMYGPGEAPDISIGFEG